MIEAESRGERPQGTGLTTEKVAGQPAPLPPALVVHVNPSASTLKALAAAMPTARRTHTGSLNVATRVLSRSKRSTFLVSDVAIGDHQVLSRLQATEMAALQDAYIASREMVVIDGYIGDDPDYRAGARLYVEASNANIAAMQQQLYFDSDAQQAEPELTIIYTPNLAATGWPDDRLIMVDLDAGVTRIFNSDYFGESKKAGLRMWNKLIYDAGGLALHAGCKVIPTPGGQRVGLIIGLSGTGKTTTTFTRQNDSLPVQDDFVAWTPDGKVVASENGCFAKTFGLNATDEPSIYGAAMSSQAYLENVGQRHDIPDFFDSSRTGNGRATFPLELVEHARATTIGQAHFLLILNRNENVIPAVAKLEGAQAAAFFVLGETQGTSAGGTDEAGRFLRVPGTNPFFPQPHALQGNRFLELLMEHPLDVYLLNTGRVGGPETKASSKKVRISDSSAIVRAIAEETIEWTWDSDFGYRIARHVPGITDPEVCCPKWLYDRTGRSAEYAKVVARLKRERVDVLAALPGLREEIVDVMR